MVTAVGGHGGYPGGKQFVSAEQLRDKLSYLRHEKALIVKLVHNLLFSPCQISSIYHFIYFFFPWSLIPSFIMQVDIVDFNGSFLARVRDFAGANPIILVITKVLVYFYPLFYLSTVASVSQPKLTPLFSG
jgi:nitric-oxide synthase